MQPARWTANWRTACLAQLVPNPGYCRLIISHGSADQDDTVGNAARDAQQGDHVPTESRSRHDPARLRRAQGPMCWRCAWPAHTNGDRAAWSAGRQNDPPVSSPAPRRPARLTTPPILIAPSSLTVSDHPEGCGDDHPVLVIRDRWLPCRWLASPSRDDQSDSQVGSGGHRAERATASRRPCGRWCATVGDDDPTTSAIRRLDCRSLRAL